MILSPFFIDPMLFFVISIYISYPNVIKDFYYDKNIVVLKNGKIISVKDNLYSNLKATDIFDIFIPLYVTGKNYEVCDAGRTRPYYIFDFVYGDSRKEIESNLVKIKFLNKLLEFNIKNDAAKNLESALKEIENLIKKRSDLLAFVKDPQTYSYRNIEGEEVLSAHSYGIAIDFVYSGMGYWRYGGTKEKYVDFPFEIVEIMEKYGFIWGGKWEHFDTMHFEYRPEFLFLNKIIRMVQ